MGDRREGIGMGQEPNISRREFLRAAGGGAALLGAGGLLAATGELPAGAATRRGAAAAQSVAKPRRGGTLRAGLSGGSSSDTLNALSPIQSTDFARSLNLFEMLTIYGPTGTAENLLAAE